MVFVSSIGSAGTQALSAKPKQYGAQEVSPGLTQAGWNQIRDQIRLRPYRVVKSNAPPHTYSADNPANGWHTAFTEKGATVRSQNSGWEWRLELSEYGYDGHMQPVTRQPGITAEGNKLTYQWDDTLSEYYLNDPNGLEQVFVLAKRPSGHTGTKRLQIAMKVRGGLSANAFGEGGRFTDKDGATAMTYGKLHVFDAGGHTVQARFIVKNDALIIMVNDAEAAYPLAIDPLVQQAYMKASNTKWDNYFGYSVSISGDTAIVGTPKENSNATRSGAAYVFVRANMAWSQQAFLKASNVGTGDEFGCSVSISGNTAIVGASYEDSDATGVDGNGNHNSASASGAAYVFTRSGTTWSQQAYLKASNTNSGDRFGYSLSISGDTAIVGAHREDSNATWVNGDEGDNSFIASGAAYVFVRTGTTWSQQAYLKASNTESGDRFGYSVSISGNTVIIGACSKSSSTGAAYIFVRNGVTWNQQAYLKASNSNSGDRFGYSVSISNDTAIVGAHMENSNATGVNGSGTNHSKSSSGAAYVFIRKGTIWNQQAYLKASATDSFDYFGSSVSISGDKAIVGAWQEDSNATGVNGNETDNSVFSSGAAYIFVRTGTRWSQQSYLKASNTRGGYIFGHSVSISNDTVIIGAHGEDSNATGVGGNESDNSARDSGAAYVFDLLPELPGPGKTLDLDGADEYVTVSNASSAFNLNNGTIEMWVKPDWASGANSGQNPCIIALRNDTSTRYSFHINDGLDGIGLDNGASYNTVAYAFTQDKWYHVAFVESGADTSVYIDGIFIGNTGNAFSAATPSALTIGWSNDSAQANEYFTGQIDEVRIWSSIRTLAEIRDNMCKKIKGSDAGLVAYYRFDQSADTILPDYTGNGHTGAAQNIEDPGDWAYSGASIGDDSAHDYIGASGTPNDFSATIASGKGDNIVATGSGGNGWKGIQVYRVDGRANDLTPPAGLIEMSEEIYWGVHVASGAAAPTYTLVHTYTGHPGIADENELDLAKRANAAAGWTETNAPLDTAADTLTLAGQAGTEFILASNTGGNTLSVNLAYFNVIPLNGRTILEWVTESEIDNAGFYVLRSTDPNGPFERITSLIPSTGTPLTRSNYLYADQDIDPGQTYHYWLENVNDSGSSTIHNVTDDQALSGCKGYDLTGDGGTGLDDVIFLLRILTGGPMN